MSSPPSASRFTPDAVNRLVKTIGRRAGLSLTVHCCAIRAATSSPTTASIHGPFRTGWGTSRSRIPPAIPQLSQAICRLARLSTHSRHLHERAYAGCRRKLLTYTLLPPLQALLHACSAALHLAIYGANAEA